MKVRTLQEMLREYPWLWAVQQFWNSAMVEVQIRRYSSDRVIAELVKAWEYGLPQQRSDPSPLEDCSIFMHGTSVTSERLCQEFVLRYSNWRTGNLAQTITDTFRSSDSDIQIDHLAVRRSNGEWTEKDSSGSSGQHWVAAPGYNIQVLHLPQPWNNFLDFFKDEQVQEGFRIGYRERIRTA